MADRVVDLVVDIRLVDGFDAALPLLPGREVGRQTNPEGTWLTIKMAAPEAPERAVAMTPWFTRHCDGSLTLGGIDYYDADHNRLN